MRTLLTVLLLLIASVCKGQWVEVESGVRGGGKDTGSGIHLGYDDQFRAIVICSGHQFRDWDGQYLKVDETPARVVSHTVSEDLDFGEVRLLMNWRKRRPSPAILAEHSPVEATEIYCYRDGVTLHGRWEPQTVRRTSRGTVVEENIFKSGFYRGFMDGVVPGWSGGPVYKLPEKTLIGMIVAADKGEVVWVPIEILRANFSSPPGLDPNTVFVGVKKSCTPCASFKRDYAQGEFRGSGTVFRMVELGTKEYTEVVQRIQRAGYQAPQAAPWFWTPRCKCNPLTDYRGVPWLLSWLPPPFTPPHTTPQQVQRYARQQEEALTAKVNEQINTRLIPETGDLKARIEELSDRLQADDPRLTATLDRVGALETTLQEGLKDPRLPDLMNKVSVLTETIGSPESEESGATGLFASQSGLMSLATDAAASAATAKWGVAGGPAAVGAIWAGTFLFNRWRRKRREKASPVSQPQVNLQTPVVDPKEIGAEGLARIQKELEKQIQQEYQGKHDKLTVELNQLRQLLAEKEDHIQYTLANPDNGLRRMRKAMEAVTKEYPQYGQVVRMIEKAYELILSGEKRNV